MSNPNQRINGPFGDSFIVNTPYLDKAANQLYVEQKQREAKQQKDIADLDNEFSKNVAGIRDADVDDLTKLYGDYKLATQNIIKNKGASPQEQLAALRKKADVYKLIGASKAQKKHEDDAAEGYAKTPINYLEDTVERLKKSRNTPLSQLGDLAGYDYSYHGQDYNGAADDLAKSRGALITKEGKPVVNATDPLKNDYPIYEFNSSSPEQVKSFYLGKMLDRKANRAYTYQLKNLPADEMTKTDALFKAIPESQWELMGVSKPKLEHEPSDDEAHAFATYMGQKAALENIPRLKKTDSRLNEAAKLKNQQAFEREKQAAAFAQANRLAAQKFAYSKALKDYGAKKDTQSREMVLNTFINHAYDNGDDKEIENVTIDGNKYNGRVIDIPKSIKDKYIVDKGLTTEKIPDRFFLTNDKKKLIPLFLDKKAANGKYGLMSNANSRPIDIENYKVDLGKLLISQKDRGSEVIDEFDDVTPAGTTTLEKVNW